MIVRGPPIAFATLACLAVLFFGQPKSAYAVSTELVCEERVIGSTKALYCKDSGGGGLTARDLGTITAILLSLVSLGYSFWKDKVARRQSIDDDYWLRKVIGPIAIEPLTKDLINIASMLPSDCNSKTFDRAALTTYMEQHQIKLQQHVSAVYCLAVVDEKLCENVVDHCNTIEDILLDYCANNAAGRRNADKSPIITKDAARQRINDELKAILSALREYQSNKL